MPYNILIVDDNPVLLETYAALITTPEVEVDAVGALAEALALVEKRAYHIVITDLALGRGGKRAGLKIIRLARARRPETHAIVMSGYNEPDLEDSAAELGVAHFLVKPVAIRELREAIRGLGVGSRC